MKDPSTVANKWAANLGRSGPSIAAGVAAVQVAPTASAAKHLDRAAANYQDAVTSGRMARALNKVTLPDWQNAMTTKGLPRIAQGATSAVPKMTAFLTGFLPAMEAVHQQVKQMPKGTTEDALARVRVNIEAGKRYKATKG